ncbi:MAG TPA: deoxyribodipyrimidine photo-lyase [Rhizomicrobium sp.]|nr:deoxyribodipyrimidine photo-lyase [Rhizomicrobium sp.]
MKPVIVWFRQDLRLGDNPALQAATASGAPLIALYVLDETAPRAPGGAARWWLHHSLTALGASLGGHLVLKSGNPAKIIPAMVKQSEAERVVWNRRYEPTAMERDRKLKASLTADGIAVESFNGALLHEPWEIQTKGGTPFRVFTPFWKAMRDRPIPAPHPAPRNLVFHKVESERLTDWKLRPSNPDWAGGFDWTPGEKSARRALTNFLDDIAHYKVARDLPALGGTSRLSPHLHWGEISPRQVWHAVRTHGPGEGAETFLKEMGWREFCAQLLFHNPGLPSDPLDTRFENFPWRHSDRDFNTWTKGDTGIPIVDAGMRQLWRTGWMHNRVRMITASLLIKHLGLHWKGGEAWFWDTLVDADLASNSANWQWVAGCGADAAPFFRIFNPVLQGEKFDPGGAYVRRFVPELKDVPDRYVHRPWEAPQPPAHYPAPILDLAEGRSRALQAFKALKGT